MPGSVISDKPSTHEQALCTKARQRAMHGGVNGFLFQVTAVSNYTSAKDMLVTRLTL